MPIPTTAPRLSAGPDLALRPLIEADIPGILEQCHDPESIRWTTVPVPYGIDDARWFVGNAAQDWANGEGATFAIELDGRFAGSIDLRFQEVDWAEVGFGLAAWARGRHVMRRSLALLLDWAFGEVGLAGVTWRAHVGNEASRKVGGLRVPGGGHRPRPVRPAGQALRRLDRDRAQGRSATVPLDPAEDGRHV